MKISLLITILWTTLMLAGCGDFQHVARKSPSSSLTPVKTPASKGPKGKVVNVAHRLLGAPYKYGGSSPRGFDCSGFTSYVFRQAGIALPRTAAAQYRNSKRIKRAQLTKGDLLFFRLSGRKISHVAIYAGDNRFIHAPSSGKKVTYDTLDNPYWQKHWIGSGRVF